MIKKSTAPPRSTKRSSTTADAIYPTTAITPSSSIIPLQKHHQQLKQSPPQKHSSYSTLGTSELFMSEKENIVLLNESDMFQHQTPRQKDKNCVAGLLNHEARDPSAAANYSNDQDLSFEDSDEKENVHVSQQQKLHLMKKNMVPSSVAAVKQTSTPTRPYGIINTTSTPSNSINITTTTNTSNATNNNNTIDKGLRHFSAKVCAKVEAKGCTSYNEVADDLVQEIGLEMGKCDHKNIRRRVYDALNVLMAIDIIRKDKKEIRWLGLPNETVDDLRSLEAEKLNIQQAISEKTRNLREVLRRCISLKNLIERNAELERIERSTSSHLHSHQNNNNNISTTTSSSLGADRLSLPFILISAARDCHVHCEMLEDRTQYFFEFNTAFQINEDIELMRLMGLDTTRIEQIRSYFPKELISHVLLLCLSNSNLNNNNNNNNNNSSSNLMTTTTTTACTASSTVFSPSNQHQHQHNYHHQSFLHSHNHNHNTEITATSNSTSSSFRRPPPLHTAPSSSIEMELDMDMGMGMGMEEYSSSL